MSLFSKSKELRAVAILCSLAFAVKLPAAGDLRLAEAARDRNHAAVVALLSEKVDVNAPQADGTTALAWAAHWEDVEILERLLRAGADPNRATDYGVTPLSLACGKGNAVIVDKLLKAGANPDIAQWNGETPLMTCARTGDVSAVKLLLSRGADVNASTRRGQTALMWAAAERHPDVVAALIQSKANVNAKSHVLGGFEPATYITYGIHEHAPENEKDLAGSRNSDGEMMQVHQDPATSKGGFTALMFAAQQGDLESSRRLLEAGANVNEASPEYGSALVMATASGHQKVAEFLLEAGADANLADGFGIFPLHYALQEGIALLASSRSRIPTDSEWIRPNMPGLVKVLLEHGADPNVRIGKGFPPFDHPTYQRTTGNSMPQLRQPGASAFLLAAATYDADLMRLLVSKGADPRLATEDGTTPLMVATGMGRYDEFSSEEEQRAFQAVQLAVELGADINAANNGGRTALHGAAYMGSNAMIELLVKSGANLETKDKYGQSALSIAEGRSAGDGLDKRFRGPRPHKSAAELLLKLGAVPLPPRPPRGG
jgi:ankyrin repeat protein